MLFLNLRSSPARETKEGMPKKTPWQDKATPQRPAGSPSSGDG